MQSSSSIDKMNCLKTCINKIPKKELDELTDNIYKTLTDQRSNELFVNYVAEYTDPRNLLDLYNTCSKILTEEQTEEQAEEANQLNEEQRTTTEKQPQSLITKVKEVKKKIIKECSFISESSNLVHQFEEALKKENTKELLKALKDTKKKIIYEKSLQEIHIRFKKDTF